MKYLIKLFILSFLSSALIAQSLPTASPSEKLVYFKLNGQEESYPITELKPEYLPRLAPKKKQSKLSRSFKASLEGLQFALPLSFSLASYLVYDSKKEEDNSKAPIKSLYQRLYSSKTSRNSFLLWKLPGLIFFYEAYNSWNYEAHIKKQDKKDQKKFDKNFNHFLDKQGYNKEACYDIREQVLSVAKPLLAAAELYYKPKFNWMIKIIDSSEENAFCLPGGKILVFTGILKKLKNEAGLAAVLGHEMGHALAKHSAEAAVKQNKGWYLKWGLATFINSFVPDKNSSVDLGGTLMNAGEQLAFKLPNSRKNEFEADLFGLFLMAASGYQPSEASAVWKRMKTGNNKASQYASTHPADQSRSEELSKNLKFANIFYAHSKQKDLGADLLLPKEDASKK